MLLFGVKTLEILQLSDSTPSYNYFTCVNVGPRAERESYRKTSMTLRVYPGAHAPLAFAVVGEGTGRAVLVAEAVREAA